MSQKSLLQTIYEDQVDVYDRVRTLIERGADVDSVTQYGESPLRVASNNGRFNVVRLLLESHANAEQLQWSPTFYAIAYGATNDVRSAVAQHDDLEHRDFWQRTPFLFSILVGDVSKSALLLELGADRQAVGRCQKTSLQYAIQRDNVAMLRWLTQQGFDIEETDEFGTTALIDASGQGKTESVRFLITQGADISATDHIPQRAIEVAANLDIVRLLVGRGDDINAINREMHAALVGTRVDGELSVQREEYLSNKHRRFGSCNPERCTNAFWLDMIGSGASAWTARQKFDEDNGGAPIWSYQRYGRTTNILDDGTIIEIAGEHEDYYAPDFCIYNDVIVFGRGGDIEVYGYPKDQFPPTDFHTATLVGDRLIIIGCLGYPDDRVDGETPVYALDIVSMKIEKVPTTGAKPGWISEHKTELVDGKLVVNGGNVWVDNNGVPDLVKNDTTFQLCVETWVWS